MLGYRCLGCNAEYSTSELLYVCEKCGENLEVIHDYKKIRGAKLPDVDSIERYNVWCGVDEDFTHPLKIGHTPLYPLKKEGFSQLYLKDDSKNPSLSFKDRASYVAVAKAFSYKKYDITGASTGNAGASMACLLAPFGVYPKIFVPATAPEAKIAQLMIFGADVVLVNGNYDDAYNRSIEYTEKYGYYNRNTGYNPWTREGKKTVSFEIFEDLGRDVPDLVFVPVGDGNIISGVYKGFSELFLMGLAEKVPKIVSVQSELSNSVNLTWNEIKDKYIVDLPPKDQIKLKKVNASTVADSISVDLPRDGLAAVRSILESGGFGVTVSDEEIVLAQIHLAKNYGIFLEPAGATAFAGFNKVKHIFSGNEKICVLGTGSGLKDIKTIMKAFETRKK